MSQALQLARPTSRQSLWVCALHDRDTDAVKHFVGSVSGDICTIAGLRDAEIYYTQKQALRVARLYNKGKAAAAFVAKPSPLAAHTP